jgi:hypothetical protein
MVLVAILVACLAWAVRHSQQAVTTPGLVSPLIGLGAASVHTLTVTGDDRELNLRFGSIPLLRKRIP